MGILTPILIRNDRLIDLERNSDIILSDISIACSTPGKFDFRDQFADSLGYASVDEDRVIVVHGGTWQELPWSIETGKISGKIRNMDYFKDCLKIAEEKVKRLKKEIGLLENER